MIEKDRRITDLENKMHYEISELKKVISQLVTDGNHSNNKLN